MGESVRQDVHQQLLPNDAVVSSSRTMANECDPLRVRLCPPSVRSPHAFVCRSPSSTTRTMFDSCTRSPPIHSQVLISPWVEEAEYPRLFPKGVAKITKYYRTTPYPTSDL